MKFQKLEVFEKHLKEAYPQHVSPVYIVISGHEGDSKSIVKFCLELFKNGYDVKKCGTIKEALDHINGGSLFTSKTLALFEGIESLSSDEVEMLSKYLKTPHPNALLLLTGSDGKNASQLYKVGKKETVVLDLSEEKPWDVKDRLQKWIVQRALKENKQMDADALKTLLEKMQGDPSFLEQEMEKLICFVEGRGSITKKDVEAICSTSEEEISFEHAKRIVWEGVHVPPNIADLSILLSFIGILRSQLEMGLKMAALIQAKKSEEEIAAAFPKLWPKALKQCLEGARNKKSGFFRKGLMALFDLEFGLKTSAGRPEVLFSIFSAKLQEAQNG